MKKVTEPEIWKDIPEYKGKYQISNCGRVRNTLTGNIIKPSGVYSDHVSLYAGNYQKKTHTIASLVGRAFVGELSPNCHYYHKNGLPHDHHARNIGIKTTAELFAKANNGKKRQIVQIDRTGEIVAIYGSIQEAARRLPFTRPALRCRCDGYSIKYGRKYYNRSVFASDGYAYTWDNEESIAATLHRMEQELKDKAIIIDTSGYLEEAPKEYIGTPEEWFEVGGGHSTQIILQLLRRWCALIYKNKMEELAR